jgi:hypothetical protein
VKDVTKLFNSQCLNASEVSFFRKLIDTLGFEKTLEGLIDVCAHKATSDKKWQVFANDLYQLIKSIPNY